MSTISAATLAHVMKQAMADGLNDAARLAQERAREYAPKQEHDLEESIEVDEASPQQAKPTSRVFSNARHAVPQHERLDYTHPNGGQAKFLENAVLELRGEIEGVIAERVRQAFG